MKNVEISGLSKQYRDAPYKSLDSINLTIEAGKTTGILGPNGAGKTTLISIICGLLDPTEGSVIFTDDDGKQLDGVGLKQMIGFVPQDFAFYEELSALQNLRYFGALYNIPKGELLPRSMKLIKSVGLEGYHKRKVKVYSGGMKRRLNLALGLLHEPTVLFLDEPTVGVDVQSRRSILRYLGELKKEEVTIIYTSHHLSEAEKFCDHFVLLDHGKTLMTGSLDDITNKGEFNNLEDLFINLTGEELRDNYV